MGSAATAPTSAATTPAGTVSSSVATGRGPIVAPPLAGTAAAAVPPGGVNSALPAGSDPAAEQRAYDAAQQLRRFGNYAGCRNCTDIGPLVYRLGRFSCCYIDSI
jgi:hypothetical protein